MKAKSTDLIPPPPSNDYIPDIQEVGFDKPTLVKVSRLIEQHAEWGQQKREAQTEQNKLIPEIKNVLGEYGIAKMFSGSSRVSYFNVPRKSLSVQKLLEHGVRPEVIAACYEIKDVPTLKITPRSEPEKEDW